MSLKPLHWTRRSHRVWECRLFAEYSLTIMAQSRGYLFRRSHYPSLIAAKQAAAVFYLAELTPLLADAPARHPPTEHPLITL